MAKLAFFSSKRVCTIWIECMLQFLPSFWSNYRRFLLEIFTTRHWPQPTCFIQIVQVMCPVGKKSWLNCLFTKRSGWKFSGIKNCCFSSLRSVMKVLLLTFIWHCFFCPHNSWTSVLPPGFSGQMSVAQHPRWSTFLWNISRLFIGLQLFFNVSTETEF